MHVPLFCIAVGLIHKSRVWEILQHFNVKHMKPSMKLALKQPLTLKNIIEY